MQDFTADDRPDAKSPLTKILQVMGALAIFVVLGYLTLRGLSLEELMLPAAALGLPVYLIVLVDPILGIAILIASIGLSPEFSVGGIRNLRMEDFLIPGLLVGWGMRATMSRVPMAPARIWAPVAASIAAMIFSTIAGASAGTAQPATAFLIMGKYAEYLVLYLLVINIVKTEAEVRALAIFAILVALGSAVLSLSGTLSYSGDIAAGRVRGPLGETGNIFGGYLALHLLLAIGLFLHTRTNPARIAGGAAVALLGISILFTYSRTTYVAIVGAILLFGAVKHRRLLIILVVLAVLIPVLAPVSVMERMATVRGVASGPTPPSWGSRLDAWEWAVNRMSPTDNIFGKGIGSVSFGDVDSEYVRIFSDMGLLGVLLFGWLLLSIGRLANRTYDSLQDFTFPRGYMAGYLMGFVLMLIHSVAATTFSAIRTEETFMLLTGLMTAIANQRETPEPWLEGRPVVLLVDNGILEPPRAPQPQR